MNYERKTVSVSLQSDKRLTDHPLLIRLTTDGWKLDRVLTKRLEPDLNLHTVRLTRLRRMEEAVR